jgi:hypothetical protein
MNPFVDANKALFYQVFSKYSVPEYVSEAPMQKQAADPALCALPDVQALPIDSKANTWLSWACLKEAGDQLGTAQYRAVERAVKQAAAVWDVSEPALAPQKQASDGAKVRYPLDGQVVHTTLIRTKEDFHKCAHDLFDPARKYPYETRQAVAKQLLKIASANDLDLSVIQHDDRTLYRATMEDHLQIAAGHACMTLPQLDDASRTRKVKLQLMPNQKHAAQMLDRVVDACREQAGEDGILSPHMMQKTAGILDSIDMMAYDHLPHQRQARPVEQDLAFCSQRQFGILQKRAVAMKDGTYIDAGKLQKGAAAQFLERVTGRVPKDKDEAQALVNTLPKEASERLVQLAADGAPLIEV